MGRSNLVRKAYAPVGDTNTLLSLIEHHADEDELERETHDQDTEPDESRIAQL